MKGIPDKSINLIIADPPYNIGKTDWDKIPNYIEWLGNRLLEMQRVLKDNGSFYLFHNDFLQMVEIQNWINRNSKFVFKQLIVWNKKFEGYWNQLNAIVESEGNRNYSKQVEYILFYTFQDDDLEQWIYESRKNIALYLRNEIKKSGLTQNEIRKKMGLEMKGGGLIPHWIGIKQPSLIPKNHYEKMQNILQKINNKLLQKEWIEIKDEYENARSLNNKIRYTFNNQKTHHSVWNYEIAENNGHVTPKPIELIKNILRHSSNEDDMVLIPFVGSGNDCIACKELKRDYIGIENKLEYVEMARQRVKVIPELLF